MNHKFFYITFYLFFSFALGNSFAQCHIWDMTVDQSDCDGDVFWVTINFNYENTGNEGFRVQGNGQNYGNFQYADLPIEIGPLEGNGVTPYEFVAKDNQFNDCHDFVVLGPVLCGTGICEIYDLVLTPTDCDSEGTYDLTINFNVQHPTHTHFDVEYAGNNLGYFALADLPVTIHNFQDNGEVSPIVEVCINDNADCCKMGEFIAPNCSGNCEIWDLDVTNVECDGDHFYITLNFNYENVGGDGFKVQGSGVNHGIFSYSELPITLGPLPANGTFWEFVVKDVNHPDCSDAIGYGVVDCGSGGDCDIFDFVVEVGDCHADGTYNLWLDFEYANPGNDFFEIYYEGEILGYHALNELPFLLAHFEDNGEHSQVIKVCINDQPGCCAEFEFEAPDCSPADCEFSGFFAEAHPCNDDGLYMLDFEFDAQQVGTEGFKVKANGVIYGPFPYGQTFYTIGPLHSGVVYEILIRDVQHPDCHFWTEWGPIFCDDDCHIYDLNAEVSDCDDLGQFYVTLDFQHANTGNDGFKVVGNGNVYGFFDYGSIPITLGPFESGAVDVLEFVVKDVNHPDCGDAVVVHVPDCAGGNDDCSIHDLVVDVTPCLGNGTFYVVIDFEHNNTSNIGFRVDGNGISYGLYGYDELPISIGPLVGNGLTPYEFVVHDLNKHDCGAAFELGPVDCDISGDCAITDLLIVPGSCHSDGTYNLWINFDFENASNIYFDVYYKGQVVDYFPLASLPVVLPHFASDGEPLQEVTICINDNADCCETFTFIDPQCMSPNMVWPGDANLNALANHFDLLNIGLAYGAEGPARSVQGIEWTELMGEDWNPTFGDGLNFKHADCDGDGKVDKEDIQAVIGNFGLTSGDVTPVILLGGNEDDPPFYVDLPGPSDLQHGNQFFAPLILGSSAKPVEDLYGLAFTLVFDPEIIPPVSIDVQYDPSWLGVKDVNLLTLDKTHADQGRIDVALVRSDQNDVSGFGQILGFIGIIDNIAGKESLKVEIENVRAIRGNEVLIPLYRPTEIVELPVGTNEPQTGVFEIFPNPTSNMVFIHHPDGLMINNISVFDFTGKAILEMTGDTNQFDMSDLLSGMYILKIETKEGIFVERLMKM